MYVNIIDEVHRGENVLTSTKGNLNDASHARSIVRFVVFFFSNAVTSVALCYY